MEFSQIIKRTEFDFDSLLKCSEAWTVILDSQQRIVSSNDACLPLLGMDGTSVTGRPLDEVIPLGHLRILLEKSFCFRAQPLSLGDRKLTCHYVPRIDNHEPDGGVLVVENQPLARDDLSCIEFADIIRSLSIVMDLAYEGTILVDHEGYIVLINQAFADTLGTRAQDMLGKHILKAYPNSQLSRLPAVMQTGIAEISHPHVLNGREVIVSRYPLIKHGRPIGAYGKIQFQDVREVLRMASEFQSTSKPTASSGPQIAKVGAFNYDINSIVGHSKVMKSLKETLLRVAERNSNILLVGESGTGKELFAHALHAASRRRYAPFIKMNCAAIPEHLLESELFGHVDGAFTGAKKGGQIGKFELAHNGTIFLDEISDMSLPMQAKLLRILQEMELTPLGSNVSKKVDVRVVAATNVKLEELVSKGKFRQDLYYRLNVMALTIPPLRERTEDIYFIVGHFIETLNDEFGLQVKGLDPQAWEVLNTYNYPGNIRELRNIIESAFNLVTGALLTPEHFPPHLRQLAGTGLLGSENRSGEEGYMAALGHQPLQEILETIEKRLLDRALKRVNGNKLQAANLLGVSRPGFYKKLRRYQMDQT